MISSTLPIRYSPHLLGISLLTLFTTLGQSAQALPSPNPNPTSPELPSLPTPSPSLPLYGDYLPSTPVAQTTPETETPAETPAEAESMGDRYGDRGNHRWYLQGGVGTNLDGSDPGSFGLVGAGLSHYFAAGQSFNVELNGLGFVQEGQDAVGLNLAVLHRWDVVRRQNWSLYIDGGVGIIGSTSDVPSEGSSFNFTPQAGGGATIQLEGNQRLMVGLRWHHISNGDTFEDNPGQDAIYGYLGINFPR